MRAASGRFGLGLGKSKDKDKDRDDDGPASPVAPGNHQRVSSFNGGSGGGGGGGGGMNAGELAKSMKGRIAHTSILPSLIGNQNLKELQDLITTEKSILQNQERLGTSLSASANALEAWGALQGTDLADVLGHANSILQHLAQAFQTYANREADIRILLKNIRTREEELEDLMKRRRNTGSRAEREEKKLAKMGQENKNLHSQTELLQQLRESMKQMDTEILVEEAKLGDYKRRAAKEALGIKFGGCFELAEKAQIVGELGKLLIEEIPLEETPAGYGRARYEGAEQTRRLADEADRVIKEVVYHPPVVKSLPPGLPHSTPLNDFDRSPLFPNHPETGDDYRRAAAAYGDEPAHSPSRGGFAVSGRQASYGTPGAGGSYQPSTPSGLGGGAGGSPGYGFQSPPGNEGYPAPPPGGTHAKGHVMFAAPESPGFFPQPTRSFSSAERDLGLGKPLHVVAGPHGHADAPSGQLQQQQQQQGSNKHDYEYEQARHAEIEERERAQAEADAEADALRDTETTEGDAAYAADATILPAKHGVHLHTAPAVTVLPSHQPQADYPASPTSPGAPVNRGLQPSLQEDAHAPGQAQAQARDPHNPPYNLIERGSTRTLSIGDWTIQSVKRPILNGKEIDAAADHIDIPLPEMTFGNNALNLTYSANGVAQSFTLTFEALSALKAVPSGEGWQEQVGGDVQVSMAEHWNQNRSQGNSYLSDIPIPNKPAKPFDWTYSTTFAGELSSGEHQFRSSGEEGIPMDLLARQDPNLDKIIFYDDVQLFEDELHDNGESVMNVRIRVMPHSFFILSRLFLRVDNVLFRTHDVRIFHQFGTEKVIREVMGRECSYGEIKGRLESQEDLSPLNDANFVTQILSSLPISPATPGDKPWPGLGVRKEVMYLGVAPAGIKDASHEHAQESLPLPAYDAQQVPPQSNLSYTSAPGSLTTAELQAQSKPKIMDRGRGYRRTGDPAGDGTDGGYNYPYDGASFFVRNHAASPSHLPREEEILSPGRESPVPDSLIPPATGGGEAFYTPVGTPDLQQKPAFIQNTNGQRQISASAFRRNRTLPPAGDADLEDGPQQESLVERGEMVKQGAEARVYKIPETVPIPTIRWPSKIPRPEPTAASTSEAKPMLLKWRFPKTYRHPQLDAQLTKARIQSEARALVRCTKAGITVPQIRFVDAEAGYIGMEWVDGWSVREVLGAGEEGEDEDDEAEVEVDEAKLARRKEAESTLQQLGVPIESVMSDIGIILGKMHLGQIVHGDLTTSNMMLRPLPGRTPNYEIVLIDFGLATHSSAPENLAVDLYVLERAFASTHPGSEQWFGGILDSYARTLGDKKWTVVGGRLDEVRLRGRKRDMIG